MRDRPGFLHIALNVLMVIAFLLLCWSGAYMASERIYAALGWEPHGLLAFLINAVLGFMLFGVAIGIIGPFLRPNEHKLFTELIEAMRQISRGDFQVELAPILGQMGKHERERHPFAQLVTSIDDMAANLKEMEELRQEFISNVSHEIGSPLTSIMGFAKALRSGALDTEERERYLDIIETECVRLSKLSDNLMKLAVLDSAQSSVHPGIYRLDKQLISLILACEPQWEAKEIDMNLEPEAVEVAADEDLMSQVWLNLLHNAIKFTPAGGRITVSVAREGGQAAVWIADNGPGIAEEDQARIFERFYKADRSRTRSGGGSGLGLSIAHKIVEMHGGSITVASKPGEGAAFTVLIPAAGGEGKS
ncbi:cell wall metabolism sensor histidine kinase WalK [Paenibacillus sp. YN15]|uniref:sensor histidine kinase n=1 Tax=Paenibacillus sp. YN15 TaxID=1742774 RepID=UPI00215CB548|nr:HAMP domain-containing sensor histidine kinase [Paenibacillus sp. YN15]